MGAKIRNQNYNDQEQEGKNKKNETATVHSRRVCKKKDLISSIERSHPSKLLTFLSHQIDHITPRKINSITCKIYLIILVNYDMTIHALALEKVATFFMWSFCSVNQSLRKIPRNILQTQ